MKKKVTLHITRVKKHKPIIDLEEMREATQEESEGVNQYIESISKETGVNFNDFLSEQPNQSVVEVLKMPKLDEAIQLHDQIADSYKDTVPDCDEAQKHRQLANWLRELKAYRKMYHEQHQDDYLR